MGDKVEYSSMRQNYDKGVLKKKNIEENPLALFDKWMHDAIENPAIREANNMSLATADKRGRPSVRQVLLKDIDDGKLVWFTNYKSKKGQELEENPYAALLFWWEPYERQVRIEGEVQRITEKKSDAYFNSRPRGSKIGATVSPQSQEIELKELENLFAKAEKDFQYREITRPPHWGGYELKPVRWEFWQGRPNRLHDRFSYEKDGENWKIKRLAP